MGGDSFGWPAAFKQDYAKTCVRFRKARRGVDDGTHFPLGVVEPEEVTVHICQTKSRFGRARVDSQGLLERRRGRAKVLRADSVNRRVKMNAKAGHDPSRPKGRGVSCRDTT